jgi:hypothetical protein
MVVVMVFRLLGAIGAVRQLDLLGCQWEDRLYEAGEHVGDVPGEGDARDIDWPTQT